MVLKDALDKLKSAFVDFEIAARSDDKTPLQNSLALNESKISFATSDDGPNVIIFGDINGFKAVNDSYSYAAGDAAINEIGKKIDAIFVKPLNALAFRQSGDEFVILLHNRHLAEFTSLVGIFASCDISLGGTEQFSVGVSFGYAISDGESDFETLFAKAEVACKEAKKRGHGKCIEWTEEIERKSLQSLRKNCVKCDAVTSCYVPQEMNIQGIRFCGICGTNLG